MPGAGYKMIKLVLFSILNPPSEARGGGLKENSLNPDSGSKNSENQNNDTVS